MLRLVSQYFHPTAAAAAAAGPPGSRPGQEPLLYTRQNEAMQMQIKEKASHFGKFAPSKEDWEHYLI